MSKKQKTKPHQVPEKDRNFISYCRGKSNIVQVFDLKKEEIVWSQDYSKVLKKPIKGLVPYGEQISNLRHVVIDESGKAIVQAKEDKAPKDLF
jgi:hypothetical protein